jgi:hypothetical protein
MIPLLVWFLGLVIIFGLIWWVIQMIPLPQPFATVAQVVIAVIFVIILLSLLLQLAPFPSGPVFR